MGSSKAYAKCSFLLFSKGAAYVLHLLIYLLIIKRSNLFRDSHYSNLLLSYFEQVLDGFPLLQQLFRSVVHPGSLLRANIQPRHNRPPSATYFHGEAIVEPVGNLVGVVIRPCAKGNPIVVMVKEPTPHVGQSSIRSTCST